MKYIYILIFLMTHDLTQLKKFWEVEFIQDKPFTIIRLIRRLIKNQYNYIFWFRLCNEIYLHSKNNKQKNVALKINQQISIKYSVEIGLGAQIGLGFKIRHHSGIVVVNRVNIGNNFTLRQNTTIGLISDPHGMICIGHNVDIGANCCLIGDNLNIGSNVTIGAMTFINKDIPDNSIVINKKTLYFLSCPTPI